MRSSKLVLMSLVFVGGFVGSSLVAAQDRSSASASSSMAAPQSNKTAAAAQNYSFADLDKHHRGYLVRSDLPESMKTLRLHFVEADYNHDGRLSSAEYVASRQQFKENDLTQQARSAESNNLANQKQTRGYGRATGVLHEGQQK